MTVQQSPWSPIVSTLSLLLIFACGLNAAEESTPRPITPIPSLPPILRDGPMVPEQDPQADSRSLDNVETSIDRAGMAADLQALRQDVARVRRALESSDRDFSDAYRQRIEERRVDDREQADGREELVRDGDPVSSSRLANNTLIIQRYRIGNRSAPATITARISSERVEVVYREMGYLLGLTINDRQVSPARRIVDLHVADMPWEEALTRLLRQTGLVWHREGGNQGAVIIRDDDDEDFTPSQEALQRRALASLRSAARDGQDVVAAQARYLIARQEASQAEALRRQGSDDDSAWRARHFSAISSFADLIYDFDTGSRTSLEALPWVRSAMIGVAESMQALGMHREAANIYRNYINKADRSDPRLAGVRLAAAHAVRQQHLRAQSGDITDLELASSLLRDVITYHGNDAQAQAVVAEARLELGQLYFDRGEYRAAREELLAHAAEAGESLSHRIHLMIAEADIALGRQQRNRGESGRRVAQRHFDEALTRLQLLRQALFNRRTDPLVDQDLYRQALFALGSVKMLLDEPDYVGALHVFLRARQRFPQSDIEGPLLINIARCYAEIHSSREHIQAMWSLLEDQRLLNDPTVQFQLAEMLEDLQVQAGAYPGAVETRVHFYLAQYHFQMAEQNPAAGAEHYERAVSLYQRVRDSNPPQYLAQAARLGLARAAFAIGDDARARTALREVLTDPVAHERDRQVAARILGDYFYRRGMYREAIEAYDGRAAQ
ncbi:MAG: hypothetical protein EA402_12600 [Planctomycetota bacterium]|nr:MAG: hypothetical protein EA402_12600 [Planctomycetota bacterium]